MGQVKNIYMDYEEARSKIHSLHSTLSNLDCYDTEVVISKLKFIEAFLFRVNKTEFRFNANKWFIINKKLSNVYQQIDDLKRHCSVLDNGRKCDENNNEKCENICHIIQILNLELDNIINELNGNNYSRIFSSEDFYNKQIADANNKIAEVEKQKKELEAKLSQQNTSNSKEVRIMQKELQALARELRFAQNELSRYETEKEEREKREATVVDWNKKIEAVFDKEHLGQYINPILNEHKRLNVMFFAYKILSAVVIVLLIIMEYCIYCKMNAIAGLPSFEQYSALIIPIPIAVGLLWGFITQANRAQLQMVALAKQIHQITYIQGLLKAMNSLSVDLNESTKKIGDTIDKMLSKYLDDNSIDIEWKKCEIGEPKMIAIDDLIKIIKNIKDVAK